MKHAKPAPGAPFKVKIALFMGVSLVWLVIDRITKIWADRVEPGTVLIEDIGGLFEFVLVHNTGAAWGMFSDSTFALGIFSLIVCAIILVLLFTYLRKDGNLFQVFFLALVFAGGLGNAIDRMAYSYVIDFINAKFISFPVFNVADIGVTCGIVLFMLATFIHDRRQTTRTHRWLLRILSK